MVLLKGDTPWVTLIIFVFVVCSSCVVNFARVTFVLTAGSGVCVCVCVCKSLIWLLTENCDIY